MDETLHFSYEMDLQFSGDVVNHQFQIKMEPQSTLRQQILHMEYSITPYSMQQTGMDGFGNQVIYGSCTTPHNCFIVRMEGEAITKRHGPEERAVPIDTLLYKYPTIVTTPGKKLRNFYRELQSEIPLESPFGAAEYTMQKLGRAFVYAKGTSMIGTTAEMAFAQGCGVCQDYAHILITLLRMAGIPSRYVVGMISGEGESHAWVEVFEAGAWYGIDPTNGLWVDENYIKISSGRDYKDCSISQGTFEGLVSQKQSIRVTVVKKGKSEVW